MRVEGRECEFRLRPPQRKTKAQDEPRAWSSAFKRIISSGCRAADGNERLHRFGSHSSSGARSVSRIHPTAARANGLLMVDIWSGKAQLTVRFQTGRPALARATRKSTRLKSSHVKIS